MVDYSLNINRRVPVVYNGDVKYLLPSIRSYYKIVSIISLYLLLVEEGYRVDN